MRLPAALACAALVLGCAKSKDAATDTAAAATGGVPLAWFAGIWDVRMMPEGRDTVVTTYVLNTTDTTGWLFAFPNGQPMSMRITGTRGDTVFTETGTFDSSLRPGMRVRVTGASWLDGATLRGTSVAHYETTGPDSVARLQSEGTRR